MGLEANVLEVGLLLLRFSLKYFAGGAFSCVLQWVVCLHFLSCCLFCSVQLL